MASPDQSTPASRPKATILLIDDQRFVGIALARLLDGEPDFQLHTCERGADAVATADRVHPDLILQDLVMPDVDGLTLVEAFRARAETARTPIVVLSGNDDAATRARALAAGAADYLVKLPSKDVLVACLRRQLSNAPSAASDGAADAFDASSDAVLDPDVLAAYRDEDAADPDETLRSLVEVFLRDAEVQLAALQVAAASRDAMVHRLAHAMKGCALAIGARRLAALCAGLEASADGQGAGPTVERIEAELVRVRHACARLAERRAPSDAGAGVKG